MKEKIINSIIKDPFYLDYCRKIVSGKDIYKDLYQYVILEMLEMEEDKLVKVNEGNIKGYICRMIWWNATSKTAPFFNQVKQDLDFTYIKDIIDEETDYSNEIKINVSVEKILREEEEYWDKKNQPAWTVYLFKEFVESRNYHEISRNTKIAYPTIRYNIKDIIKRINEDFTRNQP